MGNTSFARIRRLISVKKAFGCSFSPIVLYTDASGQPLNGLWAVLIDGDSILWTGCRCPESVISALSERATQINPLEVCGVILGLWTFRELVAGETG